MINLVVGLIFVLLLYSLLATTIMEIISSVFSMRGRNLERALKRILASEDKNDPTMEAFKDNALYKQIQSRFFSWVRPPSYMSNKTFSSILWKVVFHDNKNEFQGIKSNIDNLRSDNLREVLQHFYEEADQDSYVFRRKVEVWYDEVMDRAGGWYKRNTQFVLLVIGLVIAVTFNVDTISLYDKLSNDTEAQMELVSLTQKYFDDNTLAQMKASEMGMDYDGEMKNILAQNINAVKDPLGLGWDDFNAIPTDPVGWLYRILGWIMTALAISLGAPFWFDLLKKIVNVRSSGSVPQTAPAPIPPYGQIPTSYEYTNVQVNKKPTLLDVENRTED